MNKNKELAGSVLTYTFTAFLFLIGFDKVVQTDWICSWQSLVGPVTSFILPIGPGSIVMVEGGVEILLGVLLLTRFKSSALLALVVTISLVIADLFILHYYNLAIREVILVIVCFAIYLLDKSTPEFRFFR